MINEAEGRPRVPCISISTVLFLSFIPLAGTNNIYYFSVLFLLRPPLDHPFIIPPYRPLISRLLYPSNPLILRATLSLSSFSRSSFSRSSFSRSSFSRSLFSRSSFSRSLFSRSSFSRSSFSRSSFSRQLAWNLAFPVFISPIVWNVRENLHYESVYFEELHNEQEY